MFFLAYSFVNVYECFFFRDNLIILIVFAIIAIVILYLILLGIKDNSRTKNRQIYLGYLQLKNDTSHFCLDYTVPFKRQTSHYYMF